MITIDIEKAKQIGHNIRRQMRDSEFAPLDRVVATQIPGKTEEAEVQRQAIREKYALIQEMIEVATSPEEIKSALQS